MTHRLRTSALGHSTLGILCGPAPSQLQKSSSQSRKLICLYCFCAKSLTISLPFTKPGFPHHYSAEHPRSADRKQVVPRLPGILPYSGLSSRACFLLSTVVLQRPGALGRDNFSLPLPGPPPLGPGIKSLQNQTLAGLRRRSRLPAATPPLTLSKESRDSLMHWKGFGLSWQESNKQNTLSHGVSTAPQAGYRTPARGRMRLEWPGGISSEISSDLVTCIIL